MTTLDDLVGAVRRAGVTDPRVLDVLAGLPRAAFLPPEHTGSPAARAHRLGANRCRSRTSR